MLFPKTFTDVKFTADGSAFKTVITLCTKNWSNASCASRLKQFVIMAPAVVVLSANKSPKLTFTKPKTILSRAAR